MTKKLTHLNTFAKGDTKKSATKGRLNAIIYTRVSTKQQLEGLSLETQQKGCDEYARRNGYNIVGYFGGTYESAQSDERRELLQAIKFAKKSKEKVSVILVYSLERFSRTGDNAIWLSRQLREAGITIVSATQPMDTSNPSGVLQQNILFLFGQYDNDLRRQKCIAGMKEKLLKGEWLGVVPLGYRYAHSRHDKETQRIEFDKKNAPLIKKAFQMKIEGATNTKIAETITAAGLRLTVKRLTVTLRNPFYCGFVSHNLLEGEIVKGKHPALIREDMFLQVNNILEGNTQGYSQTPENQHLPLRRFIRCSDCGVPFTGYEWRKTLKSGKVLPFHYYKCSTIGCKCNKSTKIMHDRWLSLLKSYQIDAATMPLVREQLELTWNALNESNTEEQKSMAAKLAELKEKLEKVDDRFAVGEIGRDLWEKVSGKLRAEMTPLTEELEASSINTSCLSEMMDKSVKTAANLAELWLSGDYMERKLLQDILFPEGVVYDKKNDLLRASRVNEVMLLIRDISDFLDNKKGDNSSENFAMSPVVVPAGLSKQPDNQWCCTTCPKPFRNGRLN